MPDSMSTDDDCPPACNNLLSPPPPRPENCKTSFIFKVEIRNLVGQYPSTSRVYGILSAHLEQVQHSCKLSRHLKGLIRKRLFGKEVQRELARQMAELVSGRRNFNGCTVTNVVVEIDIVPELESMLDDTEDELCAICLESLSVGSKKTVLPCFHVYHENCLFQWLQRKQDCPLCRRPLPRLLICNN